MSYYKDLSDYSYFEYFVRRNTKNIGWLQTGKTFCQMIPKDSLLSLLWQYCSVSVAQSRGIHRCEFCENDPIIFEERDGLKLLLGTAEIRVFGEKNIYAAPNLIYHYVKEHSYQPPHSFIKALKTAPHPTDEEYFKMLENLNLEWRPTTRYEDTL